MYCNATACSAASVTMATPAINSHYSMTGELYCFDEYASPTTASTVRSPVSTLALNDAIQVKG